MSNFTTSWKLEISGKAGRSWKAGVGWGGASWRRAGKLEPSGELEKFVKFDISWKFTQVKYMYKYSISWKLDELETLTARQAGNFKIIKFIFINKFLFLFIFKKIII